jgi:phosphatidylserine/phosphatidylglycerophosphate/cardiolipin synthase-like enzyme
MAIAHIDRLDDAVGAGLERLVVAHHRRRLRRHGWAHAYAPPDDGLWCAGDPLPREGNQVEPLIDGETALDRLAADVAAAEESVLLAGWHFDPSFRLVHGGPALRELLADTAERVEVRLLAWAGAPLPLFSPSRSTVREERERFVRGTRVRMALDARERPMHCHHEKLAVIDGRIAYVGGIDLTGLAGDRLDSSGHPVRVGFGWHDASQRIEGPLVGDVAAHLALRWHEVTGEHVPRPDATDAQGETTAQFVRTVPNDVYDALPRGDFRILESYVAALRGARRFIYFENQFLWSPEIASVLREKLRHPPTPEFRILCVLPAKPNSGNDDTRGVLGELIEADNEAGRIYACALYARSGPRADPVYVHAKIAIVDDRWLTIGSANLNEHSLFNDTEMNVVADDPELARRTRLRLWAEHLERPPEEIPADPIEAIDELWKPIGEEQLERRRAGAPLTHRLVRLPHVSRRTSRILGPLNGILVDG